MEQFSLIFEVRLEWKLFKTWSYFSDRVPVQFLRSKTRNLGALFESRLSTCVNGCSKLHQVTVLVSKMFV